MRLVALISGGKDSLFNMLQCIAAGHEVVAVANIEPESKEELDSYMYQSVGHQAISLIAVALGLPIYRQKTKGEAYCKSKIYTATSQDEVEDLMELLKKVKKDIHIDGVSVGAIASDYQRTRVENVCSRLGLVSYAYLWRRNQSELLQEMIDADLDAVVIKVACIGLNPDLHLGMHIRDLKHHLLELNSKYGVNVCGEGGEYETLTTDCPLFHRKIHITEAETLILSNDAFAPVAFLNVRNAVLKSKVWGTDDPIQSLQTRLAHIKSVVKDPYKYIEDCVDEIFPQHSKTDKPNAEILPFPFDPQNEDSLRSKVTIAEYWKTASSSSCCSKPQSTQKLPLSTFSTKDTATCILNFSTGWCCVGNLTGSSIQNALACLQTHFDRVKYEVNDIVFVNIYVKDMSKYRSINKVYSQFMPEVLPPARVCVAVPLPSDVDVLMVVVSHKFLSKTQKVISSTSNSVRDIMHVQSISHWAPANIGPYSQCVRIGEVYYLAGQIPLIPGTMEILNKPIFHQCKLTFRHISRILKAMDETLDLSNIFHVICYAATEEVAYDMSHLWSYITQNDTAPIASVVVSSLPQCAQLELEIVACGLDNPRIHEEIETIDNYSLRIRRCVYIEPYTCSFVCRVTPSKKTDGKKSRDITTESIRTIIKYCLNFMRKEVKNIGSCLCMIKIFYKFSATKMAEAIFELLQSNNFDQKVVTTAVPVVALRDPDILLTITGVCH